MKTKVAFYIPKLNGGGAERVVVNLVNEMTKRQNVEVYLFVSKMGGEYDNLVSKEVIFESLGEKKLALSLMPLISLLQKYKIQTLITGMPFPNVLGVCCKKILPNLQLIMTEHNDLRNQKGKKNISLVDKLTPLVIKLFYNQAEKIIAVSKGVGEFLIELNPKIKSKIEVIYNPIISDDMYRQSVEPINDFYFSDETVYIISVARLTQQKNLELFIDSINCLSKKIDVKGIIIGQGEDEISLKRKCNELKCLDKIEFIGFKSNPYKYIKNSDILLMTSHWEGFGNVLIEAAALGTKIVSVDCPSGPREIIKELAFGRLISSKDPVVIANNLLEESKASLSIKQENLLHFSVGHITNKYIDIIKKGK